MKQLKKIEGSMLKIDEGIKRCLDGEMKNPKLILSYLNKKQKILEKTHLKIRILNQDNLVNFSL